MWIKIRLRDSRPMIGIFELIDGYVFCDMEEPDISTNWNGIIDGGHMFHRDLVRTAQNDPSISEETRAFIKKNINNPNLHQVFPRGRICYNMNTDTYEVYSNREVLTNKSIMTDILRTFGIPTTKVQAYVDNQHYQQISKEDM